MFTSDCGIASNNEVKFNVLKHGMIITQRERIQKLVVEGDSNLVIETIKNLRQGTQWEKISKIWRTTRLTQEVRELIPGMEYIIPNHVRQSRNASVDFLAN